MGAAARFATLVGLAQYGAHRMALGGATASARRIKLPSGGMDKLDERFKYWLQDFF